MHGTNVLDVILDEADCRYKLLIGVTSETLRSDPDLRLCEGLRLIEAARTAVARMDPGGLEIFDQRIGPLLRQTLMERFGVAEILNREAIN